MKHKKLNMPRKEWSERRKRISYKELYFLHFGGPDEGNKGCEREYDFLLFIASGNRQMAESERTLRLEAEKLLRDHGIEPPSDRATRELNELMSARVTKRKLKSEN